MTVPCDLGQVVQNPDSAAGERDRGRRSRPRLLFRRRRLSRAGSPLLLLTGSAPNLKPERATTWSGTLELRPPFIPGLDLQATYFNVDYRGRIASPFTNVLTALFNPLFSDLITYNPSAAEVNALIASTARRPCQPDRRTVRSGGCRRDRRRSASAIPSGS